MWNICAHTLLGSVNTVAGQSITLELLRKKPAMLEAVRPRLADEAPSLDDGHVPGDHLGAAGFDSALFTHLKVISFQFAVRMQRNERLIELFYFSEIGRTIARR